ncbi:MAG: cysteine desulfurase family protein [Candidatus Neptunochlamydia sp.]|nr:cysteine desulfurase family protein [Candidatus Neptunochlamydia sp.]
MSERIYLDNNATTPIDPDVLDAMIGELAAPPHNPSSVHFFGQEGKKILTGCRNTIGISLNIKPSEIFFTSGGTEGMNLLIRGTLSDPSSHIIASPIDHASVFNTLEELREKGADITYLPIDFYGAPKAKDLQEAIQPNTRLIVLSAANSETGIKLEMEAIAAVAKRANIPLILDGVALLGKEPFFIPEGVAAMAFSAHKFHGPQGVGFVFVRSGLKLVPLLTGGGQEKKLRSGTENLPGIVGMTHALTIFDEDEDCAYMRSLREQFEVRLIEEIPDLEVNGEGPRLPNTSNLYFPGIDAESLLISLDMEKIAVSYASACASGALEPSRTLLSMGYSKERVFSSLRFSFSRMNTPEEIQKTTEVIIILVQKLRNASLT